MKTKLSFSLLQRRTLFITLPLALCTAYIPTNFSARYISAFVSRWTTAEKNLMKSWSGDEVIALTPPTVRILALHGKGGSADTFRSAISPLLESLDNLKEWDFEVDFESAPYEGGQWWYLKDGQRSFTADTYDGFEKSCALVEHAISRYDIILGHSQGAILLSSLIALGKIFGENEQSRPFGVILNGVAWPNPYSFELERLEVQKKDSKILIVVGDSDTMNPPESGKRVKKCLEQAGLSVSTCFHPGGHSVPVKDYQAMKEIIDWIKMVCEENFNSL